MRKLSFALTAVALLSIGYGTRLTAQEHTQATQDKGQARDSSHNNWSESWSQWWSDWMNDKENGASDNARERSQSGIREFIRRHDSNEDGKLSRSELPPRMRSDFDRLDANRDGSISQDEVAQQVQQGATARRSRRSAGTPVEVTYVWILDADRGQADLEELQSAYEAMRKIDKNNDGKISRDELRARREQVASQWCDKCFDRMDQNNDGELSKSEAEGSEFASDFSQIDRNHDQQLTKSEIHSYLDEQFQSSDSQSESRQAQRDRRDRSSADEQSASRSNENYRDSDRRR